jgi:hypothetical protein
VRVAKTDEKFTDGSAAGHPGGTESETNREEKDRPHGGLRLKMLGELLREPIVEVDWLVDGLLPVGGVSVIAAKPKVGKSTLARSLALAVATGKNWLGRDVQQGSVVFLALEENARTVRRHFEMMGATGDEPIYLLVGQAPEDALAWLRDSVEKVRPALVEIDPMQRLLRAKDLDSYAEVTSTFEPILRIARTTGAHILLTHHARKMKSNWDGDAVLGSTAIVGSVDTLITMKRTAERRTLATIQREGDDLEETIIRLDEETQIPHLAESRRDADLSDVGARILSYLRRTQTPVDERTIKASVEARNASISPALRLLVVNGEVIREGGGKRNDPYRYLVPKQREPETETGTRNGAD